MVQSYEIQIKKGKATCEFDKKDVTLQPQNGKDNLIFREAKKQ